MPFAKCQTVAVIPTMAAGATDCRFFTPAGIPCYGVSGMLSDGATTNAHGLNERVPVVCAAIHGTQFWKLGNFHPVSVAWGRPFAFDGLPANGKGYREASAEIQQRIGRLWRFLVDAHALGRPQHAVPPE